MSLSADGRILQYGSFTNSETARLSQSLQSAVDATKFRTLNPHLLREASSALGETGEFLRLASKLFRPELRIMCFFGAANNNHRLCNASAWKVPVDVVTNAYAIRVNIEGIPVLATFIDNLVRRIDPLLRVEMPADYDNREYFAANGYCLRLALMFLFLHEIAHVTRGHLDIGDDAFQGDLRRTLETDADELAARWLDILLRRSAHSHMLLYSGLLWTEVSWWLSGLLACFAIFSIFDDFVSDMAACYHYPFVRLGQIGESLRVAGARDASRRLLAALIAQPGVDTFVPRRHSSRYIELQNDLADLREITLPMLSSLRQSGRLRGWFG